MERNLILSNKGTLTLTASCKIRSLNASQLRSLSKNVGVISIVLMRNWWYRICMQNNSKDKCENGDNKPVHENIIGNPQLVVLSSQYYPLGVYVHNKCTI